MPQTRRLQPSMLLRGCIAAFALAATACGPVRMGSRDRATVIFTNETLDQATVYATIAGADAVRIGTVLASRTDTLTVPSSVTAQGGPTSIIARLLARNIQPSTGPVTLRGQDIIRVRLTADGRSLVVLPE
jgi:ABC-type transport system involved in Fe-S cluster assembly fused permease/ATPase subunit